MPNYYEHETVKAQYITKEMLFRKWPSNAIIRYWSLQGYDVFWVNTNIKPIIEKFSDITYEELQKASYNS